MLPLRAALFSRQLPAPLTTTRFSFSQQCAQTRNTKQRTQRTLREAPSIGSFIPLNSRGKTFTLFLSPLPFVNINEKKLVVAPTFLIQREILFFCSSNWLEEIPITRRPRNTRNVTKQYIIVYLCNVINFSVWIRLLNRLVDFTAFLIIHTHIPVITALYYNYIYFLLCRQMHHCWDFHCRVFIENWH